MGRNRTIERRKEREQERKRQRQTAVLIGGVVIVVLAIVLLILINQPQDAPISEASSTRYAGLPQRTTDEGFLVIGSDDAPVQVVEYSSFDCTHCADFHETVTPTLIERVRAGEIQFTYVPMYGTGSITNGQGAALAAICAGEQGKFWEMHDALFSWQKLYANTAFSANRLSTGVSNLGLDAGAWNACVSSDAARQVTQAAVQAAQLQGIPGTPSVYVNGTVVASPDLNSVQTAIDQALSTAGLPPAQIGDTTEATTEPAAEATSEATTEPAAEATSEPAAEATPEATPGS
ncbi:MAG: thioredoxin domain-containing protein [Anaerolineae bacterium]|nr:thioredoxin domain-containing protein [Anaerolineae bacterium]